MESHGNVVTHLLSQVKIGMDLTKVVLPTFILERRSLLEMYADYFAHPDLFLKCVKRATCCNLWVLYKLYSIPPLELPTWKILEIVSFKWYAGTWVHIMPAAKARWPKSRTIQYWAKCFSVIGICRPNRKTPLLWRTDRFRGVAVINWHLLLSKCHIIRPVSAHLALYFNSSVISINIPFLVSAFYAEHFNKKISFSAHVWTKSKFLGLSIGVHNIGQGIVTLTDLNEEYILTFPNGYGRFVFPILQMDLI